MVGGEPFLLEFSGVGSFGDNVAFTKVKDSPAQGKASQNSKQVNFA